MAGRSRCWRAIRTSTAAAGRPTPAHKVTRFVDFAETFHLPVVHFVDIPGFVIGVAAREGRPPSATARARSRRSIRPRCRGARSCCARSFGVAGAAHQNWHAATISATPGRRATGARCRSRAASRPPTRPSSRRRPIRRLSCAAIEARLNKVRSPFRTAERFGVEEIIDPRDTRKLLCEFANLAAPLRKPGPRSFGYRP